MTQKQSQPPTNAAAKARKIAADGKFFARAFGSLVRPGKKAAKK
ncbi:MAG TPA: hypothetical protein VGT24_13160 [Candidatus Acidoferrales bacterium]|nr:hypothetical protein [Candidatus Acidoferrales bacterium]